MRTEGAEVRGFGSGIQYIVHGVEVGWTCKRINAERG